MLSEVTEASNLLINGDFIVLMSLVLHNTISAPESFVAEVAWDGDSFKVVCFNVVFYVPAMAFLSTNFASKSKLKSIG